MNDCGESVCRSCGHNYDHHRAYNVYCAGGNGDCRCEHYWAPERPHTRVAMERPEPVDPEPGVSPQLAQYQRESR